MPGAQIQYSLRAAGEEHLGPVPPGSDPAPSRPAYALRVEARARTTRAHAPWQISEPNTGLTT
ncbi:hypothetical protein [Microtetraspora sp. NBRC 16547]|uniref:hypothetical protein n=1 Tax=Microtetraspora sp. NBRC 16547 TaxID=3030993 RepID=UPI0024A3A538|nr:hypothetical protein [Microtetraspora sp. NBRC 16547]GLW99854.1 hypothetical protein Misp02_39410 [Microtetraspora sp. NBRC 16547]